MSKDKHQQLIDSGQLNPDGSRKDAAPPTGEGDAVAEPAPVVAAAVDPNSQEG